MFALIACRPPEGENMGEPEVISTHRTLRATQKSWKRHFTGAHPYRYVGILSPAGLLNYHGDKLGPSGDIGHVEVQMGVIYND